MQTALSWLPLGLVGALMLTMSWGNRFPSGDGPHLLGTAMRLGAELRAGDVGAFISHSLTLIAPHPPGAYMLVALLYALLGPLDVVPLLASLVCLALTWDAMLRIWRAMERPQVQNAWGAALLVAAAPLVWSQAEFFGFDLAATAVVCQCVSHLLASRGLSVKRSALWAGAWFGAGVWVKYTVPLFLAPAGLAVAAGLLWDARRGRDGLRQRLVNGAWLAAAAALVMAPLMVFAGKGMIGYVWHSFFPPEQFEQFVGDRAVEQRTLHSTFDRVFYYQGALKDLWGWPGLLLLLLGVGLVGWRRRFWRRRAARAALVCLTCVLGSSAVLAVLTAKQERYYLPAIFVLMAVALPGLMRRRATAALTAAVLLLPAAVVALDYSGWTQPNTMDEGLAGYEIGPRSPAPQVRKHQDDASLSLTTWGRYPLLEERYRPLSQDPQHADLERMLHLAARAMPPGRSRIGVLVEGEDITHGFGPLLLTAQRLGYSWDIVTVKLVPLMSPAGGVGVMHFQGPFFSGGKPRPFPVLVVYEHPNARFTHKYLARLGHQRVSHLQHGPNRVSILRVTSNPWLAEDLGALKGP